MIQKQVQNRDTAVLVNWWLLLCTLMKRNNRSQKN